MNSIKHTMSVLVIVLLSQSLVGCAVEPWERGTLAKPQMALDPYPLQSELRAHSYGAREAASGSSAGGAGGGCGCY